MKRICSIIAFLMCFVSSIFAEEVVSNDTIHSLDEVSVVSVYRNKINVGSLISNTELQKVNVGQGPDYVFNRLPSIFAYNDNGTNMGYTYYRMRGMGQERINVTLDGMPWNEAEDFGCYFSNCPDLMGSMHSIKAERGASVTSNGTAAYAGNISLESVNLKTDTLSYIDLGYGSFNAFRASAVYNSGVKNGYAVHARYTHQQTDGYKVNTFNRSDAYAVKVGKYFNERHSLDIMSMGGFHRNGQGYQGLPLDMIDKTPTPFHQTASGNRKQETDNFLTIYNRMQYNGVLSDDLFLSSTIYYAHQNGDYRIGWDDASAPSGKVLNNYHLNYNMFGANAVMRYNPTNNFAINGGFNAYYYKRHHQGYDIPNTDEVIKVWDNKWNLEPYYDNEGEKPDMNVFVNVKYSPVSNLTIDGSVQYRHTMLKYAVNTPAYGMIDEDIDYKHNWDFINYSFGITLNMSDNSKVYARYSVVNREPSRVDLFGGEYRCSDSEMNTDNERVHDVEVGYEIRSEKISLNANVFYMNFNDELVATGELSPMNFLPLHKQYDAYRYGVELAADYQPIENLHFILNGSLSKNKLKKLATSTFSPTTTLFGEVNYTYKKFNFGVNTNYRSSMYIDVENEYEIKDNFTLNAYVNARLNKMFEIGLRLNNITNRLNFSNGSVGDGIALYSVDMPFNVFGSVKIYF